MYTTTSFHEFWLRCRELNVHPDDRQFLQDMQKARGKNHRPASFEFTFPPCPFDGPLDKATIVICLANPSYDNLDGDIKQLIMSQRDGRRPLPKEWDKWYRGKLAEPLALTMDEIRDKVAVLNVCAYESRSMETPEINHAAGLPSVWAAQKYLRETLIPKALSKQIHLVVLRKHQLWGITEGWNSSHLHVVRGVERSGRIPGGLGKILKMWLRNKN